QTETVVSGRRASSRGNTGDTAGRCAASPAGRNRSQKNRRITRGWGNLGRFHLTETDSDDRGDPRLLHGDAIDCVSRLHRPWVVRDDDELRLVLELGQEPHITPDIGVVE